MVREFSLVHRPWRFGVDVIAQALLGGDLQQAFTHAERTLDLGLFSEEDIRRLTFPFGDPLVRGDRPRWQTVVDELDSWANPTDGFVWARFYGLALRQALDPEACDDASIDAVSAAARGRYAWMRWLTGIVLLRRARWEEAAGELAGVAKVFPQMVTAICSLSEAMIGLGRTKEALRILEAARPSGPLQRAAWWAWKGEILLWLGRYAEALECLEQAGGYDLAFCWRGAAALLLGRPDKARQALDEALLRMPNDVEARTWRSESWRLCGNHREAMGDADRVLALSPGNVFALTNRALAKASLSDSCGMAADFEVIRGLDGPWQRHLRGLDPVWAPAHLAAPETVVAALQQALVSAKGNRRVDYSLLLTIETAG